MKIESLIRRLGGSHIDLGGTSYHFKPEGNDAGGPHVAEVADDAHAARLLSINEGFRRFGVTAAEPTASIASTNNDGALVLTVPQPPSEADLLEILTSLGAANPAELLSLAWPDRFPPKQKPVAARPVPQSQPSPSIPNLGALPPTGQPQPGTPMVITAHAAPTGEPGDGAKEQSGADGDGKTDAGDSNGAGTDNEARFEKQFSGLDDDALRAEFERIVGRKPHHKALRDTMVAQLIAKLNEAG